MQELVTRIAELRDTTVRTLDGVIENVRFKLPDSLNNVAVTEAAS